jgi:hypothetical protein
MRRQAAGLAILALLFASLSFAQTAPVTVGTGVPPVIRFSGTLAVPAGRVPVTFGLYADQTGGEPLWLETQTVPVNAAGRYAVVLGTATALPMEMFVSGEARWLDVAVEGLAPRPRTLLVSVPYALKAADAETVGGRPLSAFVLAGEKTGLGADGLTYVDTRVLSTGLGLTAAEPRPGGGAGSANYLGVFTDAVTLGNSVMYQTPGGSIGVNTTSPLAGFHAVSGAAPTAYFDVYSNALAALPVVFRAARGTAETPLPVQTDDILGGLAVRGWMPAGASTPAGFSGGQGQVMFKAAEAWTATARGTYLQFTTTPLGGGTWVERIRVDPSGRVGIGTTAPTALLHVAGDAVVDGNIAAKYQDVAEWVESGTPLEAGTVVVVDPEAADGVRVSARAYDVAVAGAVSAQPGLVLGERGANKSLVAQSGRVRVKVDAKYGAIRPGDLLVTSPTPGYAMKSKAVMVHGVALHRPGTILGKALQPLTAGKGEILVLLTLQ